jgi:WD40 repeat protein
MVQVFVVTPAGDRAIIQGEDGTLNLHDVVTGKKRWAIPGNRTAVTLPTFDPTGGHFARFRAGDKGDNGKILVHRADNGKQVASVPVKGHNLTCALSPGGGRLLTWESDRPNGLPLPPPLPGGSPSEVHLWDTATGKQVAKVPVRGGLRAAAFRPDGKEVALTAGDSVRILSPDGKKVRTLQASALVSLLAYSPDGKYLAAVGPGRSDLWEVRTWRRLPTKPAPNCEPEALAFPGPGRLVATGVRHRELLVWDAITGRVTRSSGGHQGAMTDVRFEGTHLLTVGGDAQLVVWDRAGRERRRTTIPCSDVTASLGVRELGPGLRLEFSPSGRWVVAGAIASFVFDRTKGEMRFESLATDVVRIARDVGVLFLAGLDEEGNADRKNVRIWALSLDSGEELWSVRLKDTGGPRLAVSGDGKKLAVSLHAGEGRFNVRLLDATTGKPAAGASLFERAGSPGPVLEFSPDDRLVLASSTEGGLFLLDARTGAPLHTISPEDWVERAAFCPRGRMVALALTPENRNDVIHVLELTTGKMRRTFRPNDKVTALAFSPDGRLLASGHDDGTALLWDLEPTPSSEKKAGVWKRLGGADAADAYRALWELKRDPQRAVELVRKHVKPAPPGPDAAKVKRLIADLDDEDQTVRDRAHQELRQHGRSVEAPLREALAKKPSLEVYRRIERLLKGLPGLFSADMVLPLRAVELLEEVSSEESRKALGVLAKGDASSVLTQQAKSALARLKGQEKAIDRK